MKRALVVAGWVCIVAHLVGCGGEPPEVAKASEAAFGDSEGAFSSLAPGFPTSWIQQVPIGTSPIALMDQRHEGTRYEFNTPVIAVLSDGTTHDGRFNIDPSNDDFRLSLTQSGVSLPSNNITCSLDLAGITGIFNGGQGTIFADYFPKPDWHINTPANAVYYVGVKGNVVMSNCVAVGGQWNHPVRQVYVAYLPVKQDKPHGLTLAGGAPATMYVRADVDFPESGVTNRYFYIFQRISK